MGNVGCTLYIGILVVFAIDEMSLCSWSLLNDVRVAEVILEMYRWLFNVEAWETNDNGR